MLPIPVPILPLLALLPLYILLRRLSQSRFFSFPSRADSSSHAAPRPPIVVDWIPFIGSALRMTQGDQFWRDCIRGYGPVFRLRAMGEIRTFVVTPPLIQYVYKHSKNFDFYFFRRRMQSVIFGMNYNHSQSDAMDDTVFPQHHKDMQPGSIAKLIERYADSLEDIMGKMSEEVGEGKEVDLVERVFDILYEASSKAFFSPSFPHTQFKPIFMAFDTAFPLLNLAKLPNLARRPAEQAREKALDLIEKWWTSCSEDDKAKVSPSVKGMIGCWEKEGWPMRDLASLMLSEIWALEANAPYAGIWAAVELLRHPHILSRVQSEVSSTISTLNPPALSTLLHQPQPDLPRLLPLTNAVFQETLRYHVDTLSLRVVQADCVIPANLISTGIGSATGYTLKKGEQVVCATRVPSVDHEEWGHNAGQWDPDRFFNKEKGGVGSMNPFGGGVSMCEGRHFASAEILTFIAAFAHLFDARIISDSLVPDTQRPGLGVQQCKGEIRVELKRRLRS